MLNKACIMGRLTADPVLKYTPQGTAVASFTIACERDYGAKKEVDFIKCVAWQRTAEFVAMYFSKGRMAVVDGRIQMRKWTDHNGTNREITEVVANSVYFADAKKQETAESMPMPTDDEWESLGKDINVDPDDMPF